MHTPDLPLARPSLAPLRAPLLAALMALLVVPVAHASEADEEAEATAGPTALYNALKKSQLAFDQAVRVESLSLELDSLEVQLAEGFLIPVLPEEPASFRWSEQDEATEHMPVMGAVFMGSGTFQFDAHGDRTEVEEMEYFLEEGALEKEIDGAVSFTFNGDWWERLSTTDAGARPAAELSRREQNQARRVYNQRWKNAYLSGAALATGAIIEPEAGAVFSIDAKLTGIEKGRPWLTYAWRPDDVEEVSLLRGWAQPLNQGWTWETISQFHSEEDRALTRPERSQQTNREIDVGHYDMTVEVFRDEDTNEYGLRGDCTVTVTALKDGLENVTFLLLGGEGMDAGLDVRNVMGADDQLLDYWHYGSQIHVHLREPVAEGQELTLRFRYEGLIINSVTQPQFGISLEDQGMMQELVSVVSYDVPVMGWFPISLDFSDRFTFDWVISSPKPLIPVTSGTLRSQVEDGPNVVVTVAENNPVSFPIMMLGRFIVIDNMETKEEDQPVIRVYAHSGFVDSARSLLPEVQQILDFFSQIWGPFPFPEIDIVQMPVGMGFAQAPAGIIRITGETYMSKTQLANLGIGASTDTRDFFLPHELAHTWWGGLVAWVGDRDQWLHETLAEYGAAMYIYFRDGEEGYTRRMRDWYARGGDNPSRTSALTTCTRRGQGVYQNSVYARGPLVMHMLRESLGQELILKYMFTLAEYGRGGALTTDDLQLVLETVSGQGPGSFETFFDYYIRGNFDLRRPVEEVLQEEAARPQPAEEPAPVRSEPPPETSSPEGA